MTLDFQYVFNLSIMALAGVAAYLFNKSQDHERRIQKQEDVTSIKMDTLINKVDKLEASNEELKTQVSDLAHNIHKEKNQEQQLTTIMNLMLKELEKRNETK